MSMDIFINNCAQIVMRAPAKERDENGDVIWCRTISIFENNFCQDITIRGPHKHNVLTDLEKAIGPLLRKDQDDPQPAPF